MRVRRILVAAVLLAAACKPAFNAATFPDVNSLYTAAMAQYNARHYDNAAKAFERLTTELPARDARMPVAFWYLAKSQEKNGEHLLAAKSYSRIYEQFPEDTLADDGLLYSGLAYQSMWRRPNLDATYGETAQSQFQTLLGLYPDSPLVPRANKQLAILDQWFATKDYDTGYHYMKRKAFDSAIIYFKDVIRLHPSAPKTREAYLRLHEAYAAINYKDDARDLCDAMRKTYPSDRDVDRVCAASTSAVTSK